MSGVLDWTPVHTSDVFWRQNASKFEERDFQLLRVLLKLLEASREPRTLAVACADVGRFIEAHPHGRYVVADLRGALWRVGEGAEWRFFGAGGGCRSLRCERTWRFIVPTTTTHLPRLPLSSLPPPSAIIPHQPITTH